MSGGFSGRVALVTGAGRGIGRALALALAEEGAGLGLLARSRAELDEVAEAVRGRGCKAVVLRADLGDPEQMAGAAERALAELGGVDILVNNAAMVSPLGPTSAVDPGEWANAVMVNVVGAFRLTRALLPTMLDRGWGRVVNVSSGVVANPAGMIGMNAYVTSKAALEAHTASLAAELAGSGITVNTFRPGAVDTAMQAWIRGQSPDDIGAALHQRFTRNYDEGSLITPESSARTLLTHLHGDRTGEVWSVSSQQKGPSS